MSDNGLQPPSEVWDNEPPNCPGKWWMLSAECEGKPELVNVDWLRGELWAIDCAIGSLPVKYYHDDLIECCWQPSQPLTKL